MLDRFSSQRPCSSCHRVFFTFLCFLLGQSTDLLFAQIQDSEADKTKKPALDRHGDPLPPGAVARFGTTRLRIPEGCGKWIGYTPDGKALLAYSSAAIYLWDVHSGRELLKIPAEKEVLIEPAVLSPDGRQILFGTGSVSKPAMIHIWDIPSGKEVRCYRQHIGTITAIAADRKFRFVASSSEQGVTSASENPRSIKQDRTIHLWDPNTGRLIRRLGPTEGRLKVIAISPDGRFVAGIARSPGYELYLWEVETAKQIWRLRTTDIQDGFERIQFSPGSNLLVIVKGANNTFDIREAATGKLHSQFRGHTDSVLSACFSPDGKSIASSGRDNTLRIWDVGSARELRRCSVRSELYALGFSPDGKEIAGDYFRGISFWDVAALTQRRPCGGHPNYIYSLALSPDGKRLLSTSPGSPIRIWDYITTKELGELTLSDLNYPRFKYSPDGTTLACEGTNGTLLLYDAISYRLRHKLTLKKDIFHNFVFSSDGRRLFTISEKRKIQVWDVRTEAELRNWDLKKSTPQGRRRPRLLFALSPDDQLLAITDWTGIFVLDTNTWKTIRSFPANTRSIEYLSFLPDGDTVLDVHDGDPEPITQYSVRSGRVRTYLLSEHLDPPPSCAISPDGKLLATGKSDEWTLWELTTGEKIRSYSIRSDTDNTSFSWKPIYVTSVVFSHDGLAVLSGSDDTTILLWDISGRKSIPTASLPRSFQKQELDALWEKLEAGKAAQAWQAIWTLSAHPKETLPLFRRRLSPVPRIDTHEFTHLVRQLDDESFTVRERATQSLVRLGDVVYPRLEKLVDSPGISSESKKRMKFILDKGVNTSRLAHYQRVIAALEYMEDPDAQTFLKQLADGEPDSFLTKEAKAATLRQRRTYMKMSKP